MNTSKKKDSKVGKDKDELSARDIAAGVNTFSLPDNGRAVLETKEGKNNGAKPAAYNGQQTSHP